MTFFKIKNKPFHFLFVFIFACMTTKPIFASPMESSSSLSKEEFILGDENSLHLKRRDGLWHLMNCEGSSLCEEVDMDDATAAATEAGVGACSSLCEEVDMDDVDVDKIASYLIDSDLEKPYKGLLHTREKGLFV